ncbi:MAG: putative bifunctional diguanylate cyclase/phosphodiesterase [Streptosporangiaceae bacterium]
MKNPNDTRDVTPKFGSPPWFYITAVSLAGAAVLGLAVARLVDMQQTRHLVDELTRQPTFWIVAVMIITAEIWPVSIPGRSTSQAPAVSRTLTLAALLFWGFPVAVALRAIGILLVGPARHSMFRVVFNAAQLSLSLGAAQLVLRSLGQSPSPDHPLLPAGQTVPVFLAAALAYFVVNFCLVTGAISISTRSRPWPIARSRLTYQAVVHLVLFSIAPLVVLAMHTKSALVVSLLAVPLAAVYVSASLSVKRDHQANHDELTGLLNRKMLAKQSGEALAGASREDAKAGFLLIDLDRSTGLKQVNDTLGHAVGDRLLKLVAHRLEHSVRPGDVVARLGGDEFAVLLPTVREASAAREVASRLRAALAEPVRLEGMTFQVEASVGIAIYPDDAGSFDLLMQRADVAMYVAKERHSGIERYTPDADRNSAERLALVSDLRMAVTRGAIELYYQPKVRLADGKTIGMEALARWPHPRRGVLTAAEFIGLAEQSQLITELTEQVIDQALRQTATWWADGLAVQVCVNLPARDLHSIHLTDMIGQALRRHGLPPDALRLEVSEQVLAGKPAQAAATLRQLADLGVGVSLDDFGTGYFSLAQLTRLGISEVKLAPELVAGLPSCTENGMAVKSLVRLAQSLGIRSVGEGVETAETAEALRSIGCDGAQGWHFARPLNPIMATEWLAEQSVRGSGAAGGVGEDGQAEAGQVGQVGQVGQAGQAGELGAAGPLRSAADPARAPSFESAREMGSVTPIRLAGAAPGG